MPLHCQNKRKRKEKKNPKKINIKSRKIDKRNLPWKLKP